MGPIGEAMLSDGYKRFRNMFYSECRKCGSKYCMVFRTTPNYKYLNIPNYSKTRIGFKCIKCENQWWHIYNFKEFEKEIEKRSDLKWTGRIKQYLKSLKNERV